MQLLFTTIFTRNILCYNYLTYDYRSSQREQSLVHCEVLPGSHASTSLLRYRYVTSNPKSMDPKKGAQSLQTYLHIYIGMRRIAPGQSLCRLVGGFVTETQHHFAVGQSLHKTPRFDPRHRSHICAVHAEKLVPSKQLTTLFGAASWKKQIILKNVYHTTQPE